MVTLVRLHWMMSNLLLLSAGAERAGIGIYFLVVSSTVAGAEGSRITQTIFYVFTTYCVGFFVCFTAARTFDQLHFSHFQLAEANSRQLTMQKQELRFQNIKLASKSTKIKRQSAVMEQQFLEIADTRAELEQAQSKSSTPSAMLLVVARNKCALTCVWPLFLL